MLRGFLLALGLVGPIALPRAQSENEDLQAYAAALEAARASLGEGSWSAADSAWSALLAAHAGHEHARTEVEEIRLALKRARFWRRTSEPRLDEHISGKLAKHERGTGRIHVIYTPDSLGDFTSETLGDQVVREHPAHFSGPWSVEAEGPPEVLSRIAWIVGLGQRALGMRAGLRRADASTYTMHMAWRTGPDGTQAIGESEPRETKAGAARMRVEMRVGEKRVELLVDGKSVLDVPREGDDFGNFGWSAPAAPSRLELKGTASGGWLDGVRDAAVAEAWAEFEAAWQDPPEFALWSGAPEEAPLELELDALVGQISIQAEFLSAQQRNFDQFKPHLGKSRVDSKAILEQVLRLPEGALPRAAIAYLAYVSALDLGRFQEALTFAPDLVPVAGTEMQLALLDSILLERADRLDDARARLERMLELLPEESALHARLVDVHLLAGRHDEARAVLDRARRRLPASRALLERETRVVKAGLGPPWKRVHEHAGRHFLVRSEVSLKLSREAAEVLDAALDHCQERLGALPEHATRSLAYVFAGSQGYLEYVAGIADGSQENTLGIYSAALSQVVVWNQPDSSVLWDVLRHEAVHRYLHLRAGSLPRWLHEGLAESIASELQQPGGAREGRLRSAWVEVLRSQGGRVDSLQTFAYSDPHFGIAIERSYALSWAWLHFLRFEDEEGRVVFADLWRRVVDGADVNVALDEALEGRDVDALQGRFVAFLNLLLSG